MGAGNSGLRLLSQVQFDIVKIDLSLVQDGVRRLGARAVLQSLRDLALSQQAHVVAEGVETRQQLQVIRELEIGAGQGYLLGRPDASVEATFVDLGRIGSEDLFKEALALSEARTLASGSDAARLPRGSCCLESPTSQLPRTGPPLPAGYPLDRPASRSTPGRAPRGRDRRRLSPPPRASGDPETGPPPFE